MRRPFDHGDRCDDIRLRPFTRQDLSILPVSCDTKISHRVGRNMPLFSPAAFDTCIACETYLRNSTSGCSPSSFAALLHAVTPHLTRRPFSTSIDRLLQLSYHLARKTRLYFSDKLPISENAPFKSFHSRHRSLDITENVHGLTRRHACYAPV